MKKLLFLLGLLLILGGAYILLNKNKSPESVQNINDIINTKADELLLKKQVEFDETRDELKNKLKAQYCQQNSDCIKVDAPCGTYAAFNKNATDFMVEYAEYAKNNQENCTFDIKFYGEPYCKDHFCTTDEISR